MGSAVVPPPVEPPPASRAPRKSRVSVLKNVIHLGGGCMGRRHSLRDQLGLLLAAVLLPLVVAAGGLLAHQWRQERRVALARLEEYARTVQRAVDRELALDQAVLRGLASSRDIDVGDWGAFYEAAKQAAAVRPGSWFVLYRRTGENIVNTSVPFGAPLPNFRDLLSTHADAQWEGRKLPLPDATFLFTPFETGQPSYSGLFFGPVNRKPVVASTVPVTRGGKPRYALALAYASDFFVRLLRGEGAPEELTTALFDEAGLFIARSAEPDRFIARLGPAPFSSGTRGLPREGVGEGLSIESVPFVYAYSRSAANGWVIVAGMPKSAVLAPAWRVLWIWLAVLVSAGVIGSLLALRLWRRVAIPLGALAHQAHSLADERRDVPPTDVEEVEALRVALQATARGERLRHETEQEREEARRSLRDSEEKFRSIFEQAGVGIGRVAFSDAHWIDVNDAFCRMLGYSHEEMLATPWPRMTHPEDVDLDLVPFRRMAAGEIDWYSVEKRFIHKQGHEVWARLTLSLVRDGAQRPLYEIAIIDDISSRKRTEEALREANERLRDADRRKDEFLGVLSHELRNPLAPIRSSLYVLGRADPGSDQAARAREVVSRQVIHLTRLIDDLLDVTRIARGKIQLRRALVDVAGIARRAAEDHRALMCGFGIELEVRGPSEPLLVNADEARITQIVGNLLQNSRKFTGKGGRVVLTVSREGQRASIRVRDSGVGIDPALLPHLFEPFIQAKQTIARSEGGLGLGLALVRALAELHGGKVLAANNVRGGGSEFTVELPLAQPVPAAHAAAETRVAASHRSYRVLVVDDNVDAAESLAELVRFLGHEVDVAYDGPSAVAKVAAHPPEVVLCDLGLPGMSGYEVAQALRAAHDGKLQLVAISGYAQPEDVKRSMEAGFNAHVAKPADPDRLEALLT
jgi:PAS domain S-box-containing protein